MKEETSRTPLPWVIVGCGRVGRTLARLAERTDIPLRAAWDRDGPPDVAAEHRLSNPISTLDGLLDGAAVFVTVADSAIASVAAALAPFASKAEVVAHCSGSLSSQILVDAGVTAPVVSVHPLLAVADPDEAVERLGEAFWTVEGTRSAVWWARGWLAEIGVDPATIDASHKALYHAAAVSSAGLVVGLLDAAIAMAEHAGIDEARAKAMLLALARSTIDNLAEMSSRAALTGPVARGDEGVIEAHRAAIAGTGDDDLLRIYDALTQRTREIRERSD